MSDFAGFYSKSKQLFLQSGYPSKMQGFVSAKRKKKMHPTTPSLKYPWKAYTMVEIRDAPNYWEPKSEYKISTVSIISLSKF